MGKRKEIVTERVSSPDYCEGDCFVVTSHTRGNHGYPMIKYRGRTTRIFRMVYQDCWGEIPEGMVVRHKCDNPACVNPSHLELGTHQDNTNDKIARERENYTGQPGVDNPRVKITEEIVKELRADKTSTNKALAAKYGITHSNVSCIRLRKTWKHI